MKFIQSFVFAALFSTFSFGASTTASVTTIGGETPNACSETRTDGTTASCRAIFTAGRGSAISSMYQYAPSGYIWFGALHRTQTSSNITIRGRATAAFSSEFAGANVYGHGVTLTYDGAASDLETINVYANDGYGNYQLVGTLTASKDSMTLGYTGHPIDIILEAVSQGTGVTDYASLFHVDLSLY